MFQRFPIDKAPNEIPPPPRLGGFRRFGTQDLILCLAPAGKTTFDALVPDQGGIEPGLTEQSHRRGTFVITGQEIPFKVVSVGNAFRSGFRHRRQ